MFSGHDFNILSSPKPSPGQESIKNFLRKFTENQQIQVEEIKQKQEVMEEKANNFCKYVLFYENIFIYFFC